MYFFERAVLKMYFFERESNFKNIFENVFFEGKKKKKMFEKR